MSLQSAKSDGAPRRIRKDPSAVRQLLDKLDALPGGAAANARRSERFQFRADTVEIEFASGNGEWDRHVVVTRNISRDGLGCVVGQFIYPGSACYATLRSRDYDYAQRVPGKVVRCRYLAGSGSLYEVGVRFDAPVDLAMFVRGAVDTRILLACADDGVHRAVARFATTMHCTVTAARTGPEAVESATSGTFDAVLLDLELPVLDGHAAALQLRTQGFLRPIVALTPTEDDAARRICFEKGFTACLLKPVNRAQFEALLHSFHRDPVFSTLAGESASAVVTEFVDGLRDELRAIESACARQDAPATRQVVSALRAHADSNGYAPIAAAGAELEAALSDSPDWAAVRVALSKLSSLCLAARPAPARPAAPVKQ